MNSFENTSCSHLITYHFLNNIDLLLFHVVFLKVVVFDPFFSFLISDLGMFFLCLFVSIIFLYCRLLLI